MTKPSGNKQLRTAQCSATVNSSTCTGRQEQKGETVSHRSITSGRIARLRGGVRHVCAVLLPTVLAAGLFGASPWALALTAQAITNFAPATPLAYRPGATFVLDASGGASGNPVVFASATATICTVSGNLASVLRAGTCKLTANQAGDASYAAAPQRSASVVINKVSQTLTFGTLPSQVFGVAPFMVTATASSGLAPTFASGTTTVCTVSAGKVTLRGVGACTLTASQAGDINTAAATPVAQSFAVTQGSQTISFAAPVTRTFGGAAFNVSATASSALPVAMRSATPAVCSVAGKTVSLTGAGTCTLAADQAGNANYAAAPQVVQSFTVAQASQAIGFTAPAAQVFGAAPITVTATGGASGNPVTFSTTTTAVCTIADATVTLAGGGTCSIAANQAGNANYKPAPQVIRSFAVGKAAQTISFAPLPGHSLAVPSFAVSALASSGLPVIFKSVTTTICSVTGDTVTQRTVGTCTIAANQAGNVSYSAAPQVAQSFEVAASGLIAQAIANFAPATPIAYRVGHTFDLSATGGASGNPVIFASTTPAVCSVAGSTVHVLSAGTCALTANQAGNATYNAAPQRSAKVVVSPGAQTIAFAALSNQRIGADPFTISATASSGLTVFFAGTTPAVCSVTGNSVTPLAAGTCSITANQDGSSNFTAAAPVTQSFQIGQAVLSMALGYAHTCALTNAGGVQCWGANSFGQLGDGSTIDRSMPVDVAGLASGVTAIEAGHAHTCATTTSGTVKCWGNNDAGQLGDGTTSAHSTPVDVSGLPGNVIALTLGKQHSCALLGSGALQCWGANAFGQLGDGSGLARTLPTPVSGLQAGVTDVRAGDHHTCAVTSGGVIQCWGQNAQGQLGDGSTNPAWSPVIVTALGSGLLAVEGATSHSCALRASGGVQCWGDNANGQLGNGSTTASLTPVDVTGLSGIGAIAAGDATTCALTTDGTGQCWGKGTGTPQNIAGLDNDLVEIGTRSSHACAITRGSAMLCWGSNSHGQLGDGTTTDRASPAPVSGLSGGNAANQSISFGPLGGTFLGAPAFSLHATASSGLPVRFTALTPGVCSVSGTSASVTATGTCTIAANQPGTSSINAAQQVTQSFFVAPPAQAITGFAPATPVLFSAGATVPLGAAGGASGNPVLFASATPAVCTVSGNTATLLAAGTCTLIASQAGTAAYSAAPPVTATIVITAGVQQITFTAPAARVFGDAPFILNATASSGLPVSFSSTTPATCTVSGATVTLLAAGTCSIAADQGGNDSYLPARQATQTFQIAPAPVRLYFIQPDHLNTPRLITDQDNTVVWKWENQDPFGNGMPDENPSNGVAFVYNPRFPGQYFDRETGLHYNYFRDYDPGMGRYVQSEVPSVFRLPAGVFYAAIFS